MKKRLLVLMMTTFFGACVSHQSEPSISEGRGLLPVKEEVKILSPSEVKTQPDEEYEKLKSVDVAFIPAPQVDAASYMEMLSQKIRNELKGKGIQIKQVESQIDLIIPNKVAFGGNQSKFQPVFETVFSSVAVLLKEYDKTMIQLIGYTDDVGPVLTNKDFSLKKAEIMADFLRQHGIESGRIITDGLGAENPIASNLTSEGREANRRVEMTLISLQ